MPCHVLSNSCLSIFVYFTSHLQTTHLSFNKLHYSAAKYFVYPHSNMNINKCFVTSPQWACSHVQQMWAGTSCRHHWKSVITFVKIIGEIWFPSPVAQIFCPWIYEMSCLLIWNMWCFDQTDAHINAVQKFKFWSRNCVIILTPVF